MTPNSPSPYSYSGTATRTRVKWDNIAIVLMGAVVATFAVVGIMLTADKPKTAVKPDPTPVTGTDQLQDAAIDAAAGELTIDDANALVDEAKGFMTEARWDEAADRIATIPDEFRAEVGADAVELQLTQLRTTHDKLRAELTAAVEARQFKQARAILRKLAAIAALDADLLVLQEQVDTALLHASKPATDNAAASTGSTNATTSGGGGSSSGQSNNSTAPKPTTTKPKPAATTTGGGSNTTNNTTTNNTSNVTGTTDTGDLNLGSLGIDQEELEAALAGISVDDLASVS